MSSPKLINLNPEEILIGERFRKSLSNTELNLLMDSIKMHGQLQPIGVYLNEEGQYVLLYGHRRVEACKRLKRKVKAFVFDKKPDTLKGKMFEFIENAVRQDFSPLEKALAFKQLHDALKERDKDWSVDKTASLLGISRRYGQELLRVARAEEAGVIDTKKVKNFSMKDLRQLTSFSERTQRVLDAVQESIKEDSAEQTIKFVCGNCFDIDFLKSNGFPIGKFNAVVTDPPYGIDVMIESASGKATGLKKEVKFDDKLDKASSDFIEEFWKFCDLVTDKEKAVVIAFCSIEQFFLHKHWSKAYGFNLFYPKPLVWIKTSAGQPFKANVQPSACTEFFIFSSRGENVYIPKPGFPDWINVPRETKDRIHPTQKPIGLFKRLIEYTCFPDYKMLDPFAGSGSSLIAAKQYGLKSIYGTEINPVIYEKALNRIKEEV